MRVSHARAVLAIALLTVGSLPSAQAGQPGVYITEFLTSTSSSNFFVEITNLTGVSIDLSGWGYSTDASRLDGVKAVLPLSLAPLAAGESVFITSACDGTEACDDASGDRVFQALWGLSADAKVVHVGNDYYGLEQVGVATSKFQPSSDHDTLMLFSASDPTGLAVDQISYTSSLVAVDRSAHVVDINQLNGGAQSTSNWTLSYVGDGYGSYEAAGGFNIPAFEVGNPNPLVSSVPEPESYAMMLAGLGLVGLAVRRRKRSNLVHA